MTDLDRLREKVDRDFNFNAKRHVPWSAFDLIAALEQRVKELEEEKRAQFDECVATSTAYRERAEQAEAALAAMTEERDAAIMRNGAFVLSAQAEAENERLRWMLEQCAEAVCENYRGGTSDLTEEDVIADLAHRYEDEP